MVDGVVAISSSKKALSWVPFLRGRLFSKHHPHIKSPAFVVATLTGTIALLLGSPTVHARSCQSELQHTQASIKRVVDGDTVELANGQKVRIIGINTLELNAKNASDKRMAARAKSALQALLTDKQVTLAAGRDRKDRYGRLLAHIKLANGRDVAAELIHQGLAIAVGVGRNTACATENMGLERQTRNRQRGVWASRGDWWSVNEPRLTRASGFRLISSTVISTTLKGRKSGLRMANGLQLVPSSTWPLNAKKTEELFVALDQQGIEVRGWMGRGGASPTLKLHHPANVQLVSR